MKRSRTIRVVAIAGLCVVVAAAAIYAWTRFSGDTVPAGLTPAPSEVATAPDRTAEAEIRLIKEWHEAVGTIRPRTEASIEAQVTAQVMDVKVRPGDAVRKGDLLVSLDSRQFQSRLDQARQGLNTAMAGKRQAEQSVAEAEAAFERARSDYRRYQTYYQSQAATEQQLEQARAVSRQAEAVLKRVREALGGAGSQIQQAQEVVREAEISQGYTQLRAPEDGEVTRRLVDPGDLALPGKPLIVLQTTGAQRLEAYVREGLIGRIRVGDDLRARIETLDRTVSATVEEIIPYADPQTRTFLVKAGLPSVPDLFPGMFAKLLIPVREVAVVLIPKTAVRRVGQLDLVKVKGKDGWASRYVKIGEAVDEKVEVLSGLSGGETLALTEPAR